MSAAKTALLLAPAITSTCTLVYGFDQELFLRLLTLRSTYRDANSLLPAYWRRLLPDSVPRALGFLAATAATSVGAVLVLAPPPARGGGANGCWYAAAAACAAAHLAWVPWMAGPVRDMLADDGVAIEDEDGLTNVEQQLRWLRVNRARTWTTDLVGWVCALVAVTKTLAVP